ncbi:MAG: hypothetical protein GEU28_05005 [Dehalococcoidia bacterium]|nr:hypothetical protein [Dehalococcoidia bacterium]
MRANEREPRALEGDSAGTPVPYTAALHPTHYDRNGRSPALRIDYLIVADAAQIANNKLYVMGGGWNQLRVNTLPADVNIGLAVGVRVDWNETNVRRKLELLVHDSDGKQLMRVEGQFETGRPAGIPQGSSQLIQVAANGRVQFPDVGSYLLLAVVDGDELQRVPFYVSEASKTAVV